MISKVKDRQRYRSIFFKQPISRHPQRSQLKVNEGKDFYDVRLPKEIGLFTMEERNSLLNSVREIQELAKLNKNIRLDFGFTRKIYAQGMLYLFAEIDNIHNVFPNLILTCRRSFTEKINHVLYQIGIFSLCKYIYTPNKSYEDIIHWRKISGKGAIFNQFDKLVDPYTELPMLEKGEIDIFGGCIEATINSARHAYIIPRDLSPVRHDITQWWMFSQVRIDALL